MRQHGPVVWILQVDQAFRLAQKRLRLLYLSAAQAGGADAQALGGGVDPGADRTQVHVPAALGHVVRVADVVTELRPFAAHFTYTRHCCSSQRKPRRTEWD